MNYRTLGALLAVSAACAAAPVIAHHSFAVFFDETRTVAIEGKITAFRFTNPHGTIALDVTGPGGEVRQWRVETTAPVVLRRRGWSRASVRAGDEVRIEGWPARDGANYLRLRSATTADGTPIGQAFSVGED